MQNCRSGWWGWVLLNSDLQFTIFKLLQNTEHKLAGYLSLPAICNYCLLCALAPCETMYVFFFLTVQELSVQERQQVSALNYALWPPMCTLFQPLMITWSPHIISTYTMITPCPPTCTHYFNLQSSPNLLLHTHTHTQSSANSTASNPHIIINLCLNLGTNPQPILQPVTHI